MLHKGRYNTSGAAQAKVKAMLFDRWVLERILAKPTSLILAVPSRVSSTLADLRSAKRFRHVKTCVKY